MIARIGSLEVDGTETAVHLEVSWAVDEVVLATKLFFDVTEADGYIFELDGVEGLAARSFRDLSQNIVALVFAGAYVSADGIDDGVGALTHLDGVGFLDAAVVVIAVGDKDDGATDSSGLLQREHLVATGLVEGIEERGAAAGPKFADSLVEKINVVCEVLGEIGLDVEAFNKGPVVEVEDLEEKLDGGVLLELETLTDGARCVEHDADAEGKIGLLLEAKNGDGGTAVIEKAKVLPLETRDEFTLLVGDGEDKVHLVDPDDDIGTAGGWNVRLLCTGLLRGCLRRGLGWCLGRCLRCRCGRGLRCRLRGDRLWQRGGGRRELGRFGGFGAGLGVERRNGSQGDQESESFQQRGAVGSTMDDHYSNFTETWMNSYELLSEMTPVR